jgi:hypothetical protein
MQGTRIEVDNTMWFNRTRIGLAIGLLILLSAVPALAQGPLGAQLFAPADVSTYGGDIEPNQGYFFQYDMLYWSISAPKTQVVGYPGLTRTVFYGPHPLTAQDPYSDEREETSTLNSSDLPSSFVVGNRFEFGRVEDRNGWFVSVLQLHNQGTTLLYDSGDVVFYDPPQGSRNTGLLVGAVPVDPASYPDPATVDTRNLPVTLYDIVMLNQVKTWGIEANYLHQLMTCHTGGTFEIFGGARYFDLYDMYGIQAGPDPGDQVVPSYLSDSSWFSNAENHIIGPQLGMRWFKKQGRWTFSTEGRFMAGLNCQNIHQEYTLGPNLIPGGVEGNGASGGNGPRSGDSTGSGIYNPIAMAPSSGSHSAYARVFSPIVELRLEGRYQITRAISFHAGWTGFWADNIARANALINYTVPTMGIDLSSNRNKQDLFINGLTIGFDINR